MSPRWNPTRAAFTLSPICVVFSPGVAVTASSTALSSLSFRRLSLVAFREPRGQCQRPRARVGDELVFFEVDVSADGAEVAFVVAFFAVVSGHGDD